MNGVGDIGDDDVAATQEAEPRPGQVRLTRTKNVCGKSLRSVS